MKLKEPVQHISTSEQIPLEAKRNLVSGLLNVSNFRINMYIINRLFFTTSTIKIQKF